MKLSNNLTIDSQLEKYRALGFDKYRLSIIIAGLAKGLDVSYYAKISFNADKMCVIKSGLERGLDVSVYAKTYLTASQMHALRDGLLLGFDMKPYAKAKLDVLAIRDEIERLMSESNFDLVRRQKYRNYVDNIYLPLKAKLDLEF